MRNLFYLSVFIISAFAVVSCEDDDDSNCFSCEGGEVCDNGDGTFTASGSEDGEEFTVTLSYESAGYEDFEDLKAAGCDGEDEEEELEVIGCVTCAEASFQGQTIPQEEVCELANGNAEIQGIDTGQAYDQYISTREVFTTCE